MKGQMVENLLYNELLYNNYHVNVGTFDMFSKNEHNITTRTQMEIDFIAERGNKKLYIQACSDISEKETRQREIKPFLALNDSIQKILVVNKPLEEKDNNNGFIIIELVDFLLKLIK